MRIAAGLLPKTVVPKDRRAPDEVLGYRTSASSKGSTTFKRMRKCPREGALYALGLRTKTESSALSLGLLFHLGLEVFFGTIMKDQERIGWNPPVKGPSLEKFCFRAVPDAETAVWEKLAPFRDEPGYEETYPELERLLVAYFEKWRNRDYWRIIAVEETLEFHDPGLSYTARLDLIIEELGDVRPRGIYIVEHKTAGVITEDLLLNYEMDLQILGQKWLFKKCVNDEHMPPFRGVIVDIITTRHKHPKTERVVVNPSRYHLDAFEDSQRRWIRIEEVFRQEKWPKALGNCAGAARFFKKCPYYDLCQGKPEFEVSDWENELESIGAPLGFVDIHAEEQ